MPARHRRDGGCRLTVSLTLGLRCHSAARDSCLPTVHADWPRDRHGPHRVGAARTARLIDIRDRAGPRGSLARYRRPRSSRSEPKPQGQEPESAGEASAGRIRPAAEHPATQPIPTQHRAAGHDRNIADQGGGLGHRQALTLEGDQVARPSRYCIGGRGPPAARPPAGALSHRRRWPAGPACSPPTARTTAHATATSPVTSRRLPRRPARPGPNHQLRATA
jgi:hypothetical protein